MLLKPCTRSVHLLGLALVDLGSQYFNLALALPYSKRWTSANHSAMQADKMSPRREHACDRRRRWTTYGIKAQRYRHSTGRNLNLLCEFGRFDANEINTQFFNFRDKLGPPDNTYNFEIARRSQLSKRKCRRFNPGI
jgi:hypothetical protein